jgi:23S rRNA pseudouridine2605 synthase
MVGHSNHRSGEAAGGQPLSGPTGERVAKVLARAGVASRREIERLIEAGRVALNGQVLTTPAVKVGAGDILTVDGAVVGEAEPARLFRYHKPVGLVTTHSDPKGRPTVFQTLPPGLPRLISVGRLDITSEGLLLLTNDGGLARALELPSSGWPRRYRARARGRIDQTRLDRLKDGITIEGIRYGAIEASLDKAREGPAGANLWITLTLAEGKNREVRRVLEALGLTVNRLIRVAYGPFALATLGPGAVEEVGPRVIREQLRDLIAPGNLPKGDHAAFKASSPEIPRRRDPMRKASAADGATDGAPVRKAYKPGWAKPKPRATGARPPAGRSASVRPRGPRKPRP